MARSLFAVRTSALVNATANGLTLVGTDGKDTLLGGAGDDSINGLGNRDSLVGLAGNDTIIGGGADAFDDRDALFGGAGDDLLSGGVGADRLIGGDGNDVLIGGPGDDRIFGGAGIDTLSFAGLPAEPVVVLLQASRSQELFWPRELPGVHGTDLVVSIENVIGGAGNDVLSGSNFRNVLDGADGNDQIGGQGGSDRLLGSAGNDSLYGGWGRDTIYGGAGDDYMTGGREFDQLFGGAGADVFELQAVPDVMPNDTVRDFEVGVDTLLITALPPDTDVPPPMISVVDGVTRVTALDEVGGRYTVSVITTGGRLSESDIIFQ
jgi:Ca2+-binding RTX toxin-like protein